MSEEVTKMQFVQQFKKDYIDFVQQFAKGDLAQDYSGRRFCKE